MVNAKKTASALRSLVPALLAGALVGHFGITLAYLTPMSPLRLAAADAVSAYMNPLFVQRWELFAPGPADKSRLVFFKCRLLNPNGETPWIDATSALRAKHYENRLGFADRVLRAQRAGGEFLGQPADELSAALTKAAVKEDPSLGRTLDEQHARNEETGRELYARMASVECDRTYGAGGTTDVRVRLVTEVLPPFSKRNDPGAHPERTAYDLPWAPYRHVDPY